jgi:hypothetical protein
MQILDFNGIAVAAVFSQDAPEAIELPLVRHMILNRIRGYNKQFRREYGETVIACDERSWRRSVYPQYKASRKKTRDTSPLDWSAFYEMLSVVRDEIRENFPYRVISVEGAEADDIIGHLVENTQDFGQSEPVLIVSSDKDFLQLQRYKNVKQFSPSRRDFITAETPAFYLFEHICRGDSGDGVPNVLSPDDVFVENGRQRPLRKTIIDEWYKDRDRLDEVMDADTYKNYCRNNKMINLNHTPVEIREKIDSLYTGEANKTNDKIFGFLVENRCSMLIECSQDFHNN